MLRFATEPVMSHDDNFHLLMAIDWENITRFSAEIPLSADSLIIGDPAHGDAPAALLAGKPLGFVIGCLGGAVYWFKTR